MSEVLPRNDLVHTRPGLPMADFMKMIDETGGWPVGFTHVSFYHSIENSGRVCKFTKHPLRTPYWTTVCSDRDYYRWKLQGDSQ